MRIEIREDLGDKVLRTSGELGMTVTEYVNYLVDIMEIEIKMEKVVINLPTIRPNVQIIQTKMRENFAKRWK